MTIGTEVDVVVLGGGMAGCLTAYYLSQSDLNIALIEKLGIAKGASGNSAGGLNPLHGPGIPGVMSNFAMQSYELNLSLWDDLQKNQDLNYYPRQIERMFIAFDEKHLEKLGKTGEFYESIDRFSAELLDSRRIKKLVPQINGKVRGALLTKGNAAVDSLVYNQAIANVLMHRGVHFDETEALELIVDEESCSVLGVQTLKGELYCKNIVFALGVWNNNFLKKLNYYSQITPLKGEMLLLDMPNIQLKYDITDRDISLFGRGDKKIWLGATETCSGYDIRTTEEAKKYLIERGKKIMPDIVKAKILKQTAGLRPMTSDGFPLIGQVPGWRNAYVSGGTGRKGTLLSAGAGKYIADMITTGKSNIAAEFANLNRF